MSSAAKNDATDAEAICEAMSRPGMRFVPVKSAERQAELMLLGLRDLLMKQRTAVINTIRGHAAEFGVIAAKGPVKVAELLTSSGPTFRADDTVIHVGHTGSQFGRISMASANGFDGRRYHFQLGLRMSGIGASRPFLRVPARVG